MPADIDTLAQEYQADLLDYLQDGGEAALLRAYDGGRQALLLQLGVLDMTLIHQSALIGAIAATRGPLAAREAKRLAERGGDFLTQSLMAFEIVNRGVSETNVKLRGLNQTLEQRVTERTEALGQAEEKYRSIFENSVEGIFQSSPDGVLLAANPAMARIYGYASPEKMMASVTDMERQLHVEPERRAEFARLIEERDTVSGFEAQVYRTDGSVIWISTNARAVRDAHGRLLFYEGTVEDITERKRVEEQLRHLSQAVEQSPAIIVITDIQGRIEYVNPKFSEVTGYTPAEVIGQNPQLLKSGEMSPGGYKRLWETIAAGGQWRGEFHNRKKSGDLFWTSASISAMSDTQGRVTHFLGVEEDITERKRAEEELRAVLTNARCILWRADLWDEKAGQRAAGDLEGGLRWRTHIQDEHAAQQVLPLEPRDGLPYEALWMESRHSEDRRRIDSAARRAILQGAPGYTQEFRCTDKFGHLHWLHEETVIVPVEPGRWQLFGVATDVTERRRTEEELRESEERLREVMTHARCLLWSGEVEGLPGWDQAPGGHHLFAWHLMMHNAQAAQQVIPLDVRPDDSYLQAWADHRSPEDDRRCGVNAMNALLQGDDHVVQEYRCTDKHGHLHWLHEVFTIQPVAHGRWRVFGVATDVTERKQAEEELRAVLTNTRCVLWRGKVVARDGWEQDVENRRATLRWQRQVHDEHAAQQVLPLNVPEGSSYKDAWMVSRHDDDRWRMNQTAHHALLVGAPGYAQEFRCTDKFGQIRWLQEDVVIHRRGANNWKLYGVATDVTERKQAEEALRAKHDELQAMSQQLWQTTKLATVGELAASIAHELNNPMATVSLRVESLLAQTPAGDAKRRALEIIEQETERMANLVSSLLQFSRRSGAQISTLDVREEIEGALELIHFQLRNRRVTVRREFAEQVPMLQADRQQLRQLFLNLFTNASDAMPQGGTLTVRVCKEDSQVVIEVGDTGEGIAPEALPKVFESFFTTKPQGKGTGLGLPICRRIVEEHRGTLDLSSVVGEGTTVRITLPVGNGANGTFWREETA